MRWVVECFVAGLVGRVLKEGRGEGEGGKKVAGIIALTIDAILFCILVLSPLAKISKPLESELCLLLL